jgi:hypothetical protein
MSGLGLEVSGRACASQREKKDEPNVFIPKTLVS